MPLDVLGCTLHWCHSTSFITLPEKSWVICNVHRDGDRSLQLWNFNEEFLVSASHQLVLITSLPFVHIARRSCRLSDSVNNSEIDLFSFAEHVFRSLANLITQEEWEVVQRFPWVKPAEGSFTHSNVIFVHVALRPCKWRSDVYVHCQGWEMDLLITVTRVRLPLSWQ